MAVEREFVRGDLHGEMAGGEGKGIVDVALGGGFILPVQSGRSMPILTTYTNGPVR